MSLLYMGLTILFAHTIGVIAGFGPTVLALPLLLLARDIYFVRPLLTAFGLGVTSSVFLSSYKHLNVKLYLTILLVAGTGLPIGMLAYNYLPQKVLLLGVGFFTLIVAIRGIIEEFFKVKKIMLPDYVLYPILFMAGVLHGAFTTGGPLMVIFVAQKVREKGQFRATQGAVWITFNIILSIQLFFFSPKNNIQLGWEEYRQYLFLLPFLFTAITLGAHLQKKVSPELFRKIIYLLLFVSGASIVITKLV